MFIEFTALGLPFTAFVKIDKFDNICILRMANHNNNAMFLLFSAAGPEIKYAIQQAVACHEND
jgi:hypothetical protein